MAKQIEAGMTEHLAFDQFQAIDPSFGLSIAPGRSQRDASRCGVVFRPAAKVSVARTPELAASASHISKSACGVSALIWFLALQACTRTVNARPNFATVADAVSCSTRTTTAASAGFMLGDGCTSNQDSCCAEGSGGDRLAAGSVGTGLCSRQQCGAVLVHRASRAQPTPHWRGGARDSLAPAPLAITQRHRRSLQQAVPVDMADRDQ